MEQEFNSLIQENRGIIYKVIRLYIDHPEDEKDVHQEILYQAWHSFSKFRGDAKFSTWLYKVCLNTVLTFKKKTRINLNQNGLEGIDVSEGHAEPGENSERLYRAIKSLPEIDKMIITLHLDGYPNEEIATIAGFSKNNLGVRLHRIKEGLMKTLNPE